ncbi:MAG TPA: response regulator [Pyrinomonadaceae bacterium]|jgi:CheY-like chemotaxis protein
MNTPDTPTITHTASPLQSEPVMTTRATILLVEDDRSVRRYLEVILQRAGYGVISAADGLEAMKAALSSDVHAVVTDDMMPHLSGHELCRFIRRHPKFSRLPVVLLSGHDQTNAAHTATHGGSADAPPDAYLAKPVRPEELTGCIARLLACLDARPPEAAKN